MEKVGRNDPCPCGSGKKFKKCCEDKVKHKKFDAQVLSNGGSQDGQTTGKKIVETDKAAKLSTGFFQRIVAPKVQTPPPPQDHPDTKDTPL